METPRTHRGVLSKEANARIHIPQDIIPRYPPSILKRKPYAPF